MLADERLSELLQYIREKRVARYTQIASDLHVSQSTVRRDAAILETQGYVDRIYGGVRLSGASIITMPLPVRIQSNSDAKDEIARQAAAMLHDDMSVFLFSSSTVMRMGPHMSHLKKLRVLTNSTIICEQLTEMGIETYCTGGRLRLTDHVFVGAHAERTLRSFRPDASFFSPNAISEDGDITVFSEENVSFIRLMMERSRKMYILCDSTKLNRSEFFSVGTVSDADAVFCDQALPESMYRSGGKKLD